MLNLYYVSSTMEIANKTESNNLFIWEPILNLELFTHLWRREFYFEIRLIFTHTQHHSVPKAHFPRIILFLYETLLN